MRSARSSSGAALGRSAFPAPWPRSPGGVRNWLSLGHYFASYALYSWNPAGGILARTPSLAASRPPQ